LERLARAVATAELDPGAPTDSLARP
jgi:hypothetical protein